jgi:hypothetical protein
LSAASTTPGERAEFVLLAAEAKSRGHKNALAMRRWCRRYNVPITRLGKQLWVRPSDVDAVLRRAAAGEPLTPPPPTPAPLPFDPMSLLKRGLH